MALTHLSVSPAKNVAADIAVQLCESVANKLEGKVMGTFSSKYLPKPESARGIMCTRKLSASISITTWCVVLAESFTSKRLLHHLDLKGYQN